MYDKVKGLYEADYLKILQRILHSIYMYHIYTFNLYTCFFDLSSYGHLTSVQQQRLWNQAAKKARKMQWSPLLTVLWFPNLEDFHDLICLIGTIWLKDTAYSTIKMKLERMHQWIQDFLQKCLLFHAFVICFHDEYLLVKRPLKEQTMNSELTYVPQTSIMSHLRICPWMFQILYYII